MRNLLPEHLGGIATFVTAARSNSFTDAAQKLGVSKSAVGKSIAKLERDLAVKLFHRSTRKLSLTADGEAYYQACNTALDEIASVEQTFARGQLAPQGTLRIDMPVSFGRKFMLPVLATIAHDHPGLNLALSFTDHEVDPIEDGIDLLVRFGDLKDSSDLVARLLTRQRRALCAAPAYLALHGTPDSLDDLSAHKCLVMSRRSQPLHWIINVGSKQQRFLPAHTHTIGDGDALLEAAALGLGICQFPHPLLRDHLETGRLIEILEPYSQTRVDVHLVWPKSIQLRPKIRFVVDRLAALAEQGTFGQ